MTTSGSVLWVTVPVNADGPSLALSVLAVAFALRYRGDPRLRTAVWMGLAAGAAVSIKALSVPALVIVGLVVLLSNPELRTGVRDATVAAGIAVGVYVVTALPFGIADVWQQSYSYHQDAPAGGQPRGRLPQGARHALGPRQARDRRARAGRDRVGGALRAASPGRAPGNRRG